MASELVKISQVSFQDVPRNSNSGQGILEMSRTIELYGLKRFQVIGAYQNGQGMRAKLSFLEQQDPVMPTGPFFDTALKRASNGRLYCRIVLSRERLVDVYLEE